MGYWTSVRWRWLILLKFFSWGVWGSRRRTRPISSHLDRTSLVKKGFAMWLSGKFFFAGHGGEVPSRQDSSILLARVANHSTGFHSSCTLTELAIYNKCVNRRVHFHYFENVVWYSSVIVWTLMSQNSVLGYDEICIKYEKQSITNSPEVLV